MWLNIKGSMCIARDFVVFLTFFIITNKNDVNNDNGILIILMMSLFVQ